MNQEVGQIVKNWGGCREILGGVNDFRVQCEYQRILGQALECL